MFAETNFTKTLLPVFFPPMANLPNFDMIRNIVYILDFELNLWDNFFYCMKWCLTNCFSYIHFLIDKKDRVVSKQDKFSLLNIYYSFSGERPHHCDFPRCGKTFTQSGNLKSHLGTHINERPYICPEPGIVSFTFQFLVTSIFSLIWDINDLIT